MSWLLCYIACFMSLLVWRAAIDTKQEPLSPFLSPYVSARSPWSTNDQTRQIVVANVLAGIIRRLMPVLVLAVKEGGLLCLSGLRPSDVPLIKR